MQKSAKKARSPQLHLAEQTDLGPGEATRSARDHDVSIPIRPRMLSC